MDSAKRKVLVVLAAGGDRMRKSRFSEEQIIGVLKAAQAGQKVGDLPVKVASAVARIKSGMGHVHLGHPG